MKNAKNISIVGGGLVGSLLSIFLAKKGFQVQVFERRPDMRNRAVDGGRSINLALSNRGWRALDQLGLSESIRAISIPMEGRMIHQTDGEVNFQAYGRKGEAIYSVSRGELNNALDRVSNDLPNVTYHYETQCKEVDLRNGTISFQKENETITLEPDLIIGADGAFSKVRQALQKQKRFNYAQEFLPHGYKELNIPAAAQGGWQLAKNALHIWPRRSFMLIALPNLDGSFTCTLFLSFEGKDAFENLNTPNQIRAFFEKEFADALPLMPTLIDDFLSNPTDALVTIRCNPWTSHRNEKNVCIIGDASHAIVPFYGQGMNSGFEDCRVFSEIVDDFLEKSSPEEIDWEEVLKAFSKSRVPDANAIADLALKNFVEMRDSVADDNFLLRKKIEKKLQADHPEEFTPAYSLVTFRDDVRYSEALRRGKIQDALFNQFFKQENIAQKWENNQLDDELNTFMQEYLQRIVI